MKCVLDSTVFFLDFPVSGELYTTPLVMGELIDLPSKCRFEKYVSAGLRVLAPQKEIIKLVRTAAEKTRDSGVISETDCEIIALALDLKAVIYTDDFAIQNIAMELHIPVHPIQQRTTKKIVWKYRCSGCGRYFETDGECPICGSKIKRKLK
ncbi:MAG: nucleotide-binding protein [Methanoregula sp.]